MKPIDFRTSYYFPTIILIGAVAFLFVGFLALFVKIVIGIILIMLGLFIFSTHYRFIIDLDRKIFREYLWIAGFKSGEIQRFEKIEYLYITKSRVSQTMRSRGSSSTFRKEVFNGYLKFSDEQKIHLFDDDTKEDLIEKLKAISGKLNIEIHDRL